VTGAPLKALLEANDPKFWDELAVRTRAASEMEVLLELSVWRQRGLKRLPDARTRPSPLRVALLGGYTFHPLATLLTQILHGDGLEMQLQVGDFDNYVAELTGPDGELQTFKPEVIVVLPGVERCRYGGAINDPRSKVEAEAVAVAAELLRWCQTGHDLTGAEFILANHLLPARDDLGEYRSRTAASDWTFRKLVNLELGLRLPPFGRICDVEFLCHRLGATACADARRWFESKQPGSPLFLVRLARELAWLIRHGRQTPRKVLVTDLDNTLWGGVLADDGLEGIELGSTSPRGEAFRAFQQFLHSLKQRGVLLAICSKNEEAIAFEALDRHPEMALRREDFAAMKINWQPKPDNLRVLADELGLGLDSFVFVDDNPAEIEIVRQFAPQVEAIRLGPDPADYIAQVQDARCFEPRAITAEDTLRAGQYRAEAQRRELRVASSDLESYLQSLEMVGTFRDIQAVDASRLAQLTQRTNQFNLTTRRRTEAEILGLERRADVVAFSFRLRDRFGDHGLIALLIAGAQDETLEVDTWLMSCRVLSRQVEETILNQLVSRAKERGFGRIRGVYLPTAKNGLVRELYPRLGFTPTVETPARCEWELVVKDYADRPSPIRLREGSLERE
jgi:FkbH-like protein